MLDHLGCPKYHVFVLLFGSSEFILALTASLVAWERFTVLRPGQALSIHCLLVASFTFSLASSARTTPRNFSHNFFAQFTDDQQLHNYFALSTLLPFSTDSCLSFVSCLPNILAVDRHGFAAILARSTIFSAALRNNERLVYVNVNVNPFSRAEPHRRGDQP